MQPDGSVRVFGSIRIAGFGLDWEEPPADWIAPRWFEMRRLFSRGPIRAMTTTASLEDRGGRSGLEMRLAFDTGNPIGILLARRLIAAYEPKVRGLLETADGLLRAERSELFQTRYRPTPSVLQRGRKIAAEIAGSAYEHGLANRLLDYINESQDVDLQAMRPIAIARRWGADSRDAIELFLQAVRSGLLESRWDILCPRCRVGKSSSSNLAELPRGVHCDACNIDFGADFARNVELSFSPSPAVRPIENGVYCRSGPGVTPHIRAQCSLAAGESRSLPLTLAPGDFRVRTLEAGAAIEFRWEQGPFPAIRLADDGVSRAGDSRAGEINLSNAGGRQRTLVIEDRQWMRDVLTAERATTLQVFRDLFSDQVLRPGDEVSIRNISFAFTDLVGSADLFSRIGDAAAYRLIREHFALLAEIVRRHRGNIVKTVGDGVHAAFHAPDDALRAALEMQYAMPEFNRRFDAANISIRIGLHCGNSIAVTLNDRLDYYGEAVNLAARLETRGEAGGITMSRNFSRDPAVSDILREYEIREWRERLKGFPEDIAICQIFPRAEHERAQ